MSVSVVGYEWIGCECSLDVFYPFLVLVEVVWVVGVIELDVFLAIATEDYFAVVAIRCVNVAV